MRNPKLIPDGYGGFSGTCKQCHAEFKTDSNHALFCSTSCRVAFSRRKQAIQRHRNDALYAIRALIALAKDVPEWRDDISKALRLIHTDTGDAIRTVPDKEMHALNDMLYGYSSKRN
jgi:hypothetical protein